MEIHRQAVRWCARACAGCCGSVRAATAGRLTPRRGWISISKPPARLLTAITLRGVPGSRRRDESKLESSAATHSQLFLHSDSSPPPPFFLSCNLLKLNKLRKKNPGYVPFFSTLACSLVFVPQKSFQSRAGRLGSSYCLRWWCPGSPRCRIPAGI